MNNHFYIGIEDLGLTGPQRAAIVQAFKNIPGVNPENNACFKNHWKVSLDGDKAIFEARFNTDHLTVSSIKNYLASAVGVNANLISAATTQSTYGTVLTFSAGGNDKLRMIAFSGIDSTWEESRQQVFAYLQANSGDWVSEVTP